MFKYIYINYAYILMYKEIIHTYMYRHIHHIYHVHILCTHDIICIPYITIYLRATSKSIIVCNNAIYLYIQIYIIYIHTHFIWRCTNFGVNRQRELC